MESCNKNESLPHNPANNWINADNQWIENELITKQHQKCMLTQKKSFIFKKIFSSFVFVVYCIQLLKTGGI
jgi:hypothetical protein